MSILGQFRAAIGQSLLPWDDGFFQGRGYESAAGMHVSPETAMRLSAVFACVRVRSETFGACPAIIGKRYADGREEIATEHPLYSVLHTRPNQWQTPMEFFEMMQAHLDLRGNSYARIVPGPRGPIDQLVPLHPDLVQVFRLPNGKLKYQVRARFTAEVENIIQDDMFHMRGLSLDGLTGLSPISWQREMVGRGLGMQDYGARFFANDSRPPGFITHPGKFKDDAARLKFKDSYQLSQSGENRHKTPVFEEGMEYKTIGLSNVDSQFIEAFKLNREEIAGIYRVPPHKIGILERSTNNNIEHQGIEFVSDCMHPISGRWEARVNCDLLEPLGIEEPGVEYFVKFKLDGLLRGDLKSRYDAYKVGRDGGWLNPNRICQMENMNPIPAEQGGDDYLRPINMAVAGAPEPQQTNAPPDNSDLADPSQDTVGHRFAWKLWASDAARRMVGKEAVALRKLLRRATGKNESFDDAQFHTEAQAFYAEHSSLVSEAMKISKNEAERYAGENLRLLHEMSGAAAKASAIDWIEDMGADALIKSSLDAFADLAPVSKMKGSMR
jgi:HK97 family phage portal protein